MLFKSTRQGYPYLNHTLSFCYMCSTQRFVALYKAILWVRVIKEYVIKPASKEDILFAIRRIIHWQKICGLSSREFVKVAHIHGCYVPSIMRNINKVLT